jgi:uncharacterized membrane protein
MWLLLLACVGEEESKDSTASFCRDTPVVNYENFGRSFLTESCDGCHAATSVDRHDAPDGVTFDTVEEAWRWDERILARAASAEPDMPPQGGVSEDDRIRLQWWLLCAEPGT